MTSAYLIWTLTLLFVVLGPLQAQLVITEFMAQNNRTLKDDDGDFSDWIEVQNQDTKRLSLLNWALTDTSGNKAKWTFPATNLGPGEFLIVFASEKNRRQPGLPLHTNFKLSDAGEYLALIKPGGVSAATEFSPRFPAQLPDISYGYGMEVATSTLVTSNQPARWLVPALSGGSLDLGEEWRGGNPAFDDSHWQPALGVLGFSRGKTNLVAGASLGLRLNFDAAPVDGVVSDSKPLGTKRNGVNQGATWSVSSLDAEAPPLRRAGVMSFSGLTPSQISIAGNADLNVNKGSLALWVRSGGNTGPGQEGAILFDRRSTRGDVLVLKDDGRLFVQAVSAPGSVRNSFTSNRAIADDRWHLLVYTFDQTSTGSTALYIDGVLDRAQTNTGTWAWDATARLELGASHDSFWRRFDGSLDDVRFYKKILSAAEVSEIYTGDGAANLSDIVTDVGTALQGVSGTLLLRVPFTVVHPDAFRLLTLRIRYDDGFAAFLNGQEIARDNAPNVLDAGSRSTDLHDPNTPESITFGNIEGLLRSGTNILAVHGLNLDVPDEDFLLDVQLTGTEIGRQTAQPRYFRRPTPSEPNGGGTADLGPIISEATHSPQIPTDADDLLITARVLPAFNPVQSVTLRYRVMFGVTNAAVMRDDGLEGDRVAGDGIFTGIIPSTVSTNGQLVRYFVTSLDTLGNTSRWPLFDNPIASEEYLGTVVRDPTVLTRLPVYQLFVRSVSAMDNDTGTQASFFYNGELYDNIFVRLKGGTTRSLNKKAHRLDFLKSHLFKFSETEKPVRELALNAEFIDPSYLRQNTSFWLFNQAGTPAPLHFPVRLQLNGQFHELAFHTETLDRDLLERMGLNPEGALYKNALMLNILPEPAIGGRDCREAEKQTRLNEDISDLVDWTTGIAENRSVGQRRQHLFDTTDIPSVINYLACFHLTQQADGVHANVCPHRDSGETDEWRLVPWDMNLSMGQVWAVDHITGNEDDRESHPFYGASGWRDSGIAWSYNRLFDALIVVPELREMYLRRLRSLMDELLQPPGTPGDQLRLEARIRELREQIEPEALADRKKWGWAIGYSGYAMTNVPFGQAVEDLLVRYVGQRRTHFYGTHHVDNTSYANRAGIPGSQPASVGLQFGQIETTPATGNPLEEFVELQNTNAFAVDLSGWRVTGGINFMLRPGTVVPAGGSLYLSPNVRSFRGRATSPRGGEGRFVQGPYQGQLANRGELVHLTDPWGRQVASARTADAPSLVQRFLRIGEVMFHPPEPTTGSAVSEDFEYLELVNTSTSALDLSGVGFTDGIEFRFGSGPSAIIPAGGRMVLVKNVAAFRSRYGNTPVVGGVFNGSLDNSGERIRLIDALGEEVQEFRYDPTWVRSTDGLGFSLIASDLAAQPVAWSQAAQWRPSGRILGSPGTADVPVGIPRVIISEVLANPGSSGEDQIELQNLEATPVEIGYWFVTDDPGRPKKYRVPAGVVIAAGGFWVLHEADFNPTPGVPPSFALRALGDEVALFSANSAGELTGYSDEVRLPASLEGVSLGRWTLRSPGDMAPQVRPTWGATNSPPQMGPLIITEIHYHAAGDSDISRSAEFVEVHNVSAQPLRLFEPASAASRWQLAGDVDFPFPTNTVVEAGARVVVVGFDPVLDREALNAFRSRWQLGIEVPLLGPYRGTFDHGGGSLRVLRPGTPFVEAGTGLTVVPLVVVDEVSFDDNETWPELADGAGPSLHRHMGAPRASEPSDWFAALPSPGTGASGAVAPRVLRSPTSIRAVAGTSGTLEVSAAGDPPLKYQWRRNGEALLGEDQPVLKLPRIYHPDSGCYDVVVMNAAGAVRSDPAMVEVILPPIITLQPTSRILPAGTNITLRAGGIGTGDLAYQWLWNGTVLPNASDPTLVLGDVKVSQSGSYVLRVTDVYGTVLSDAAQLTVAILPSILVPPQPAAVVAGGTAVFSVAVNGTGPFTYRWRKGTTPISTQTLDGTQSFLVVSNIQPAAAGSYSIAVGNVLGNARTTPSTTLVVLNDTDGDRIPDAWEESHGLDPRVAEGDADLDQDGMTNREEYLADTDPGDPLSRLEIALQLDTALPTLVFHSRSNHTYSLQFSEDLAGGWQKLRDLPAQSENRNESIPDPGAAPVGRFYRLVTPVQP